MLEFIAKLIVDLSDQKMYVYNQQNEVIKTLVVSTGKKSSPTPIGNFKIYSKYAKVDLVGDDYRIPSKNVMCFFGPTVKMDEYCIHPTPPGNSKVGVPLSKGCVRTTHNDAKWIFDRTKIGTPVVIQK